MKLNQVDAMRCINLFDALDVFALEYFDVFEKDDAIDMEDDNQLRSKIRSFWQVEDNDAFIEKYIASKNVQGEDAALLRSWKNRARTTYMIIKHTREYTIFYSSDDNSHYAVLSLTQSLKDMVPEKLPFMVKTALFPYGNSIIYDGIIATFPVTFGKSIRANVKEELQQAIVKKTFELQSC